MPPATSPALSAATPPACALLLAAGRGERMRPLTDTTPKPLLQVQGKALLRWHLEALARGGCGRAVVNTAWLEEQIEAACAGWSQDAPDPGVADHPSPASATSSHGQLLKQEQISTPIQVTLSAEGRDFGGALETLGGISRALPLLDDVFWVAAADVFVPQFNYAASAFEAFARSGKLAHLWLVPNPAHNPRGDFGLSPQGLALNLAKDSPSPLLTYSTIGLYRKALFAPPWCDIPTGNPQGAKAALAPLLRRAMDAGQVSAELYAGPWTDVGTPERLAQLNRAGATIGVETPPSP